MAHSPAHQPCLCSAGGEPANTLTEMQRLGQVTRLDGGLDMLALLGTELSDALISTNNGAALLTGRGGYGRYQTTAMPFRVSHRRINLRVAPERPLQVFRSHSDDGTHTVLVVANGRGEICHRITAQAPQDVIMLNSIDGHYSGDMAARVHEPAHAQTLPDGVVSLAAVRSARNGWDQADSGSHLNEIMLDQGHTRLSVLPHIGTGKAWPVRIEVLQSFFTYLAHRPVSHTKMVPADGILQCDVQSGGDASLVGRILVIRNAAQNFAIDLDQISTAWVTCVGPAWHLEIYDACRHAIAILSADPMANFADWNSLLASLPTASNNL